jgi:alpha-D-ribose 1-methylphosphonate 5-triphosphate synthase subunit PhnH
MQQPGTLLSAFADPVHDAQQTFRLLMEAYSAPATICRFAPLLTPPAGLNSVTTSIILTLADRDAPVWLDSPLDNRNDIADYIRFHTGARIVTDPGQAAFAIVDGARDPDCTRFNTGTLEYPDRSGTLIVQTNKLLASGMRFSGPGLKQPVMFTAHPLWPSFEEDWRANGRCFPRGLDFIITTPEQLAAMPRSLRLDGDR